MNNNKNTKKAFSLLELIIVIAIMGILLAIAIPKYLSYRETAIQKANEANIAILENAIILYLTDDEYVNNSKENIIRTDNMDSLFMKKYIKKAVFAPGSKNKYYTITINSDGTYSITNPLESN